MYCKNCGKVISEDARFCMYCGTPVEIIPAVEQIPVEEPEMAPVASAITETVEPEISVKRERPVFEEINWNVSEYPDNSEVVEKTDDIDFNWNANPADIPEPIAKRELNDKTSQATAEPMDIEAQTIDMINGSTLESELFGEMGSQPEELSASERIDKFYTFNKKNEEFQALLNREYSKVKSGNAIGSELSMADELAAERFETRASRPKTMEDFLEEEGVVKPYQPKAFESDVLQRIEAQEAAREAKRREDEARAKAIEEARREAEAAKLAEIEAARKAAEEAKAKAEAEAREAARMAEEARIRAEEEAKARAEELARREAEEAKLRAEAEARRIAEEEARIKAEAVARYQAAEEARIRAEEELKAAQEAAKIKAQQEARRAAEAQARFEAEQEKRRLAEAEANSILEAKRSKLVREANETIAAEEARKVLEQTARMRDEESAKIRAAVASLRSGSGLGSTRTGSISREAAEAHRATQAQISEMAKARNTFLGDFNIAEEMESKAKSEPVATAPVEETPDLSELIFGKSEPIRNREPEIEKIQVPNREVEVTSRDTMLNNDMSATRVVDKAAILAGIKDDTIKTSKTRFAGMAAPEPLPKNERKYDDIDELLSQLETVENDVDEELARGEFKGFDEVEQPAEPVVEEAPAEPAVEELKLDDVDDIFADFEPLDDINIPSSDVEEPTMLFTPATSEPAQESKKDDLSGTKRFDIDVPVGDASGDTIVIGQPQTFADLPSNDFDDYGNEEAARLIEEQSLNAEPEIPQAVVTEDKPEEPAPVKEKKNAPMSKKEKKAAEKAAKAEAKAAKAAAKAEAKAEGGKGSVVLKVILAILCIVLIAEVAGIAVHFVAPQSKAAEIVDTQLNMLIHKFTGEEDTQYNVFSEQRRVEALDDKTTLIEAKADMNYNNGIGSIVWNQDLKYTDADGEEVMDLVLSMPITDVEWGRDENNGSVYYDEQVVGEVIAYESTRYAYINDGDEKVMDYIDQTSGLNATLQEKKGTGSGTFERLEIGEIRTSGSSYYAWVNEVMSDQTVRKVLKMIPGDGYNMQMVMAYTME